MTGRSNGETVGGRAAQPRLAQSYHGAGAVLVDVQATL